MSTQLLSNQTQKNWWINLSLFISAIIAALSGIYFLFIPSGGFQGGRNPMYNVTILFTRHTWENFHTWGGLAMILVVVIHLVIHWSWVANMTRRTFKEPTGQCGRLNPRGRWNFFLNIAMAISFLLTAISGVYFLFVPSARWAPDPMILFSRTTWDLLHTWASVLLISIAMIHFAIHWKWITKVTHKMLGQVTGSKALPQPESATILQ